MKPRILIIDDNASIHQDMRKVLAPTPAVAQELEELEALMFSSLVPPSAAGQAFDIDSAYQGREGLAAVEAALAAGRPYSLAFVDMRMPPGWDGLETIRHLLRADPDLQVVICTAFSDRSWREIAAAAPSRDQLLVLKKPFDSVEIVQIAHAVTKKWQLARAHEQQLEQLEAAVADRTELLRRTNGELLQEMQRREQMEAELRVSQKLEAIGQLAAGIAHEINTPIQYVGDSVDFLRDSFTDLSDLLAAARRLVDALEAQGLATPEVAAFRAAEEKHDAGFILEEAPPALDRARDGIERVAKIVCAMKDFSHPGQTEMSYADLGRAIEATMTVARNEYKYVADVVLEIGESPQVRCLIGELTQVFLNLVVNAAHAIAEKVGDSGERGTITVSTRVDGDEICVTVRDTGTGIPESHRSRIFDPFFTTKEVGKGTGQGLALAHNTVVVRHRGRITLDSVMGEGSAFHVWLPVRGAESLDSVA